jgi:hypothetical protein
MREDSLSKAEQHKGIIRRLYREAWTAADFANLNDLLAPRFTFCVCGG